MKSEVEIDAERPEQLKQIIGKSLEENGKVSYEIQTQKDKLVVRTKTEGLGPLRGCTDTVFRLTSLAKKLY
jgi:tRNA threonylcarbamoyladenosine modification (KEOPS) complex  Pcc1 subunit